MLHQHIYRCWVWSLIIFLVFRCLVSAVFGPHTPMGGCGGAFPPTTAAGGVTTIVRAPPRGGSGEAPSKGKFYEKCLVKYCNFVVNLDHSLCRKYDDRSYVNLRFFCPRRQPCIIMRELYYDCVLF
jgi:hypothetical protein